MQFFAWLSICHREVTQYKYIGPYQSLDIIGGQRRSSRGQTCKILDNAPRDAIFCKYIPMTARDI